MNAHTIVYFLVFLLGLSTGSATGAWYARAQRGWADYVKTKKSLPELLRTAWKLTQITALAMLVVGAGAVVVYAMAAADGPG